MNDMLMQVFSTENTVQYSLLTKRRCSVCRPRLNRIQNIVQTFRNGMENDMDINNHKHVVCNRFG